MLILEGPDCVGKTTLAKALLKQWNSDPRRYGCWPAIYQAFSRLPDNWHHYKSYLPYITRGTIQDRFHLSELVYSFACRGEKLSKLTPEWLRLLEARLTLAGSVTVVVTATNERIEYEYERQAAAGKVEMFTKGQVIVVNDGYKQLVAQERPDWLEAKIDFHYHLDADEGKWPSDSVTWMDQVLTEWSRRLGMLYSLELSGQSFFGPCNKEAE